MSLISVNNLTFAYEGSYENIFEDLSFQIDTDWKLGFTGRNGRGKTTFLKLLLDKYEYSGSISANVDFEYFPYEVDHTDYLTIDIIREIASNVEDWKISKELSLLEAKNDIMYRQFYTLSKGEQTKAMLVALFLKENAFLLIDEPTNHLDAAARETVSRYLEGKKGFILVSHDRYFLDNCIDHVLAINRTNIDVCKGNFSQWWEHKEQQDSFEISENEKLKGDIKRLSVAVKRTSDWSDRAEKSKKGTTNSGSKLDKGYVGHKAAKMMKRAKNIEVRQVVKIEQKSRLLKNRETSESLKITPLNFYNDTLAEFADLSISYGDRIICDKVNFKICQGDRIALKGKNGCGKSSLIKLLCGENIPHIGELRKNNRLTISYVSQVTDYLCGSLSAFADMHGIDESLFKAILRKLDFSREQFDNNIENFSGGQKKKVLIARSLCEKAHLYIWDEPLNFIDVVSRMQIEELLLKFHPTIIFVEHDRNFLENIATKIIEL
ncbi:ribosomal protection-like ABC-F family protein [Acetobacterium bakii]|uniref:Glycosyl transferase family 1 n=1 Tax=Acetobacterium bakii TaxID=52689 RepID=A0A0L6U467_9FIRM|nr:ABC-F type ribosomal protection protein [Acetobacterium bakii]KNZ42590.1 glycosyl transferase family 1 [Acetobacterium bakii]